MSLSNFAIECLKAKDFETGMEYLNRAANTGDIIAVLYLGRLYQHGFNMIKVDLQKAVNCYKKAAEAGDSNGQLELGYCYLYGHGTTKNSALAFEWLRKSTTPLAKLIMLRQGLLSKDVDRKELIQALEREAETPHPLFPDGNPIAQYNLGYSYEAGNEVSKGAQWYKRAADQGHANAQFSLGCCYSAGNGVPTDATQAVKWFQKSADQGFAQGYFNLANCYSRGTGVEQNHKKAMEYHLIAAELGHIGAQCSIGYMYDMGHGVEKNMDKALEWYFKSGKSGHPTAQYNLGICYEFNKGVGKDLVAAAKWYKRSAKQGYTLAMKRLDETDSIKEGIRKEVNVHLWSVLRLILLARLKNDPDLCQLARLPKDLDPLIIHQLKEYVIDTWYICD